MSKFLIYFTASRNINNLAAYSQELEKYYLHLQRMGIVKMTYNILTIKNISFIAECDQTTRS